MFPILASSYTKPERHPLGFAPFWDLAPALVYCSVFLGSTPLTEGITAGKYPGYKAYQQRVSMFVPWLTPVWGFILQLKGKKVEIDTIVYGNGEAVKRE